MKEMQGGLLRLVLIECTSPLDTMVSQSELGAVAGLAKLVGHSVLSMNVISRHAFEETCDYIGSMCSVSDANPDAPLCLHISAHGADDGLLFGADEVSWVDLLEVIQPVLNVKYAGPRVLVISACDAHEQQLTKAITAKLKEEKTLVPPRYVFCSTGSVAWPDAAMAWALLYHKMPLLDLNDKVSVQQILKSIKQIGIADIVYFRWDDAKEKYMRYAAK